MVTNRCTREARPEWLSAHRSQDRRGLKIFGVRIIEWAVMPLALAVLYPVSVLLNRGLTAFVRLIRRQPIEGPREDLDAVLPTPARLLLLSITCRALLQLLPFSKTSREFWSSASVVVAIISVAWLIVRVNGTLERYILRRLPRPHTGPVGPLLRLTRRLVEVLIWFAAMILVVRNFGIDPTPALAGLGIGGVAVALAAQKTLENVIGGASLIFDGAVQVGDSVKMGQMSGTVEFIGLRSTRIRTVERTVVSVPNGQLANSIIETLSARDQYLFHPIVCLRFDTTPAQLRAVIEGAQAMLSNDAAVDPATLRVRFLRLGAFSLDVEVFAYVKAADWSAFLEIQERLLVGVTGAVEAAGTSLALPPAMAGPTEAA
jgi:MscS family membrane protein